MSGAILVKAVKDVTCEELVWVAVMIVVFCNLDVTKVTDFGSSVSGRALVVFMGVEEVINKKQYDD